MEASFLIVLPLRKTNVEGVVIITGLLKCDKIKLCQYLT
jgi:hypothetical protein